MGIAEQLEVRSCSDTVVTQFVTRKGYTGNEDEEKKEQRHKNQSVHRRESQTNEAHPRKRRNLLTMDSSLSFSLSTDSFDSAVQPSRRAATQRRGLFSFLFSSWPISDVLLAKSRYSSILIFQRDL